MFLHNRINRKELEKQLQDEPFRRYTVSFYRYVRIENPQEFRDLLYQELAKLRCLGRIYIASEGINSQMSVPEYQLSNFSQLLNQISYLKDVPLKWAFDDNGKSFSKLTIKVRHRIVADGLQEGTFDVTNVGTHLSAEAFHRAMEEPDALVVDMRNRYETEIGHFRNALYTGSETFSQAIIRIADMLAGQTDKKLLLYCTGGIRCEKASAYLKHRGFKNVFQLYGGIIEYARTVKQLGLPSKFSGKNFVFDRRMGEEIDGRIISRCHQCGAPANRHINCANNRCHLLFIQCENCSAKYSNCCCEQCALTLQGETRVVSH